MVCGGGRGRGCCSTPAFRLDEPRQQARCVTETDVPTVAATLRHHHHQVVCSVRVPLLRVDDVVSWSASPANLFVDDLLKGLLRLVERVKVQVQVPPEQSVVVELATVVVVVQHRKQLSPGRGFLLLDRVVSHHTILLQQLLLLLLEQQLVLNHDGSLPILLAEHERSRLPHHVPVQQVIFLVLLVFPVFVLDVVRIVVAVVVVMPTSLSQHTSNLLVLPELLVGAVTNPIRVVVRRGCD